ASAVLRTRAWARTCARARRAVGGFMNADARLLRRTHAANLTPNANDQREWPEAVNYPQSKTHAFSSQPESPVSSGDKERYSIQSAEMDLSTGNDRPAV